MYFYVVDSWLPVSEWERVPNDCLLGSKDPWTQAVLWPLPVPCQAEHRSAPDPTPGSKMRSWQVWWDLLCPLKYGLVVSEVSFCLLFVFPHRQINTIEIDQWSWGKKLMGPTSSRQLQLEHKTRKPGLITFPEFWSVIIWVHSPLLLV